MKTIAYNFLYENEMSHWWYRGRRELIHGLIKKHIPKHAKIKILDVGCGTGALMGELGQYGEVYGVDNSSLAVDFCHKRGLVNVVLGKIEHIPFPDNAFDLVIALDVMEHIKDDVMAILEIKRVLKEGGQCIIFVPTFMLLWGEADVMGNHYRRYRLPQLKKLLSDAGFTLKQTSYFNTFLFFPIAFIRLLSRALSFLKNTESGGGSGLINILLYCVFHIEVILLNYISFPFGVSCLVVGKKDIK